MNPWILAARPRTLGAAAIPVLAGAALAFSAGSLDPLATLLIVACAVLIQIATNYFNDAIDHAKGADTAERLGPTRVTSSGLLAPRAVIRGGVICLALAVALSIPLVLHGGWPIVVIGVFSLFFAYAYTGGPFPLAYLGLGEIFVVLFFGIIAVAGTFYLNALEWSYASLLAGLQIGLHSGVLLAVNNRRENAVLVMAPFILGLAWLPLGFLWAFLLPLMTLPLAWWLARACLEAQPDRSANQLLAQGAALHAVFGILLSIGFLLP
jgi:1,4-dihydroxy-2-naphthoate octaprenyltransferase